MSGRIFTEEKSKLIRNRAEDIQNWAHQFGPKADALIPDYSFNPAGLREDVGFLEGPRGSLKMADQSIAQRAWLQWMMQPVSSTQSDIPPGGLQAHNLYSVLEGAKREVLPGAILNEERFVQALAESSDYYYWHEKVDGSVDQRTRRRWTVLFNGYTDIFPKGETETITFREAAKKVYIQHLEKAVVEEQRMQPNKMVEPMEVLPLLEEPVANTKGKRKRKKKLLTVTREV